MIQGGLWGSLGAAPQRLSAVFVAARAHDAMSSRWSGPIGVVRGTRTVVKGDLVRNGATPDVVVDGERREVRINGEPAVLAPVGDLPLNRAYFLA